MYSIEGNKVKRYWSMLALFFLSTGFTSKEAGDVLCGLPGEVYISGSLEDIPDKIDWVYFYYQFTGNDAPDSAKVIDGKYSLKKKLDGAVRINMAASTINERGQKVYHSARLLLGAEHVTIQHKGKFSAITVSGSEVYKDFEMLEKQEQTLRAQSEKDLTPEAAHANTLRINETVYGSYVRQHPNSPAALYALRMYGGGYAIDGHLISDLFDQFPDSVRLSKAGVALSSEIEWSKLLGIEDKEVWAAYVRNHPASPIALQVLEQYAGYNMDVVKVAALFQQLPAVTRRSPAGKKLARMISIEKGVAIGNPAPDFVQKDTSGNAVSLASFRGKFVLIDFWASWCVPCRKENPNLVAAFEKYGGEDFTIIGIALEMQDAKQHWLNAIRKDKLNWTHVSDFKYWQNEVAVLYGVTAVPQNFLIDKNGIIIARNLHGAELQETLKTLLN